MASYHYRAGFIGRSGGRSAVAGSAYLARAKLRDERQGLEHDYRHAHEGDRVHAEVLAPEGAPAWARDREALWNRVEATEDALAAARFRTPEGQARAMDQAQTAYSIRAALPRELSPEAQVEVARSVLEETFVSRGLVVDFAVHSDPGNPHLHAQVTLRALDGDGFSARKERMLFQKPGLLAQREAFARAQNEALRDHGHDVRVDHRSFADRGIAFEPTSHEGPYVDRAADAAEWSRIRDENLTTAERNAEIALADPEAVIAEVAEHRATVTEADLAHGVAKRVGGDPELERVALGRVLASPELVAVGSDLDGTARFTTQRYLALEGGMFGEARALAERGPARVAEADREGTLAAAPGLSAEQRAAVQDLTAPGDLKLLVGRAGSGKTTTLRPVVAAHEASGARVLGAALSGVAAKHLGEATGTVSRTLHSWEHGWEGGHETLSRGDVLVIDEAGMVGTAQLGRVLARAREAGAKVILVGDPDQLQPIEAGAPFRGLLREHPAAELAEIHRQREPWQRAASTALFEGRTADAVTAYAEQGRLVWGEDHGAAMGRLVDDYLRDRAERPDGTRLALAHERADVAAMNAEIRAHLRARGALGPELEVSGRRFAVGDRVAFLRNDYEDRVATADADGVRSREGVRNGTLGRVLGAEGTMLSVRLDDGREASVDLARYEHVTHGYAVTVHKAQGATVDRAFVLAGRHLRRDGIYPALTRHTQDAALYASREAFGHADALARSLGRQPEKDLVADYTIPAHRRAAFERVRTYRATVREAAELYGRIERETGDGGQVWDHPEWDRFQALKERRTALANGIAADPAGHQDMLRLARIRREVVEQHAGLRARISPLVEREARAHLRAYRELTETTRDLWNTIKKTHPAALSREHPDFPKFEALRAERDAQAARIAGEPALYRGLAREERLRWGTIAKHAEGHAARVRERVLSERERPAAEAVRRYQLARVSARFWARQRGEGERTQRAQAERDRLAARFARQPERFGPLLEAARIGSHEIARGATRQRARQLVRVYARAERLGQAARQGAAAERLREDLALRSGRAFVTRRALREAGLDRRDVVRVAAARLEQGTVERRVAAYVQARAEATVRFRRLSERATQQGYRVWEHPDYPDWREGRAGLDRAGDAVLRAPRAHEETLRRTRLTVAAIEEQRLEHRKLDRLRTLHEREHARVQQRALERGREGVSERLPSLSQAQLRAREDDRRLPEPHRFEATTERLRRSTGAERQDLQRRWTERAREIARVPERLQALGRYSVELAQRVERVAAQELERHARLRDPGHDRGR